MSPSEIEKILHRRFSGIRPARRGLKDKPITIGFDIETCDGIPYILGIESTSGGESQAIGPGEGLPRLLQWVKRQAHRHGHRPVMAGAHNLRFDLGALFYDWRIAQGKEFPAESDDLRDDIEGGRFHLWIGTVSFATFRWGHYTVNFIDTFAYFKSSLIRAVASLGLGDTKADFPGRHEAEWYSKRFPLNEIGPYCLQDAHLARLLLDQIVDWWMVFGIRSSISGPQMAGRIFCKEFVERPWVKIPETAMALSLFSYHGGRNLFTGEAGWFDDLRAYDVNSAYTWAMTKIPDMTEGVWEAGVDEPESGSWGFVVFLGRLPRTAYPVLYDHSFAPYWGGEEVTEAQAVTTMEWDLMKAVAQDWHPREIGWVCWRPSRKGPSDLARYAVSMWQRRQMAGNEVEQTLYKFLSNSLYGKFIARSPNEDGTMYTGALFYPPVASWITALVRTLVIKAEFGYECLHTATDGVMTLQTIPTSSELGGMKLECEGPALIFRNKLYLHWDRAGKLQKMAKHGFQGNLDLLLTMLREGRRGYGRKRLRGWREAKRHGSRPFAPITVPMELHLEDGVWTRIVQQSQAEPYRSLVASALDLA